MDRYKVMSPGEALAYLTDCTLATVETMAMKKSRSKNEYARQIRIAQDGVSWMQMFSCDYSTTRADDVIKFFNGNVDKWAKQYEV